MPLSIPVLSPAIGQSSGRYYLPPNCGSGIGDLTPSTSANVTAWRFFAPVAIGFDLVRMRVTTGQAGAEAMAGVYTDSGANRPAALLDDLGTGALTSNSTDVDFSISPTLHLVGHFWVLIWLKNVATQATVRGPTGGVAMECETAGLTGGNNRAFLYLASAYPVSMPSTAPAVVSTVSVSNVPLCIIRTA